MSELFRTPSLTASPSDQTYSSTSDDSTICALCNKRDCGYLCYCEFTSDCPRCINHLDEAMEALTKSAAAPAKAKKGAKKRKEPDTHDADAGGAPPNHSDGLTVPIEHLTAPPASDATATVTPAEQPAKKPRKPRGPNKPKVQLPAPAVVEKKSRKPRGPNKPKVKLDCDVKPTVGTKRKDLLGHATAVIGKRQKTGGLDKRVPAEIQSVALPAQLTTAPFGGVVIQHVHRWA
jgi:hypothetical protein